MPKDTDRLETIAQMWTRDTPNLRATAPKRTGIGRQIYFCSEKHLFANVVLLKEEKCQVFLSVH